MSTKAIKSLIELFGVEDGVYILNLFTTTAPLEATRQHYRTRPMFRPNQRETKSRFEKERVCAS